MKRCLIIQPHSDDALFSASHLLLGDKYKVEVLTVENNSKRIEEDKKLYEFLGIPYKHLGAQFKEKSFFPFYKKYKEVNSENAVSHLTEFFGKELLDIISAETQDYVAKYVKRHPDALVYVPWGVGHPMHIFIRDCVIKVVDKNKLFFYRDFPHSYKKRARSQIEAQLQSFDLKEQIDVKSFHDVKWELARKFYKTQSGLFWFEQSYIKKQLPEEVYVLK